MALDRIREMRDTDLRELIEAVVSRAGPRSLDGDTTVIEIAAGELLRRQISKSIPA